LVGHQLGAQVLGAAQHQGRAIDGAQPWPAVAAADDGLLLAHKVFPAGIAGHGFDDRHQSGVVLQ
jgi:hypothetical protein